MPNKVVITDTIIDKMTKPKKTPRKGKKPRINFKRIWDSKVPGLFIQMSPTGVKTKKMYVMHNQKNSVYILYYL